MKCSGDVGAQKCLGSQDGSIDVAFGGKVQDCHWPVFGEQPGDHRTIADVAFHEDMQRIALERGQVAKISGIGQQIEIDYWTVVLRNPMENEIRSDESCAARYEKRPCIAHYSLLLGFYSVIWSNQSDSDTVI